MEKMKIFETSKKWWKQAILIIIISRRTYIIMKFQEVVRKQHVSIIQDQLSNLNCVQIKSNIVLVFFDTQKPNKNIIFELFVKIRSGDFAEFLSYLRTKSVGIWFQKVRRHNLFLVSDYVDSDSNWEIGFFPQVCGQATPSLPYV